MDNNMNLNQHKFMSQVPMSEVKKLKMNLELGYNSSNSLNLHEIDISTNAS